MYTIRPLIYPAILFCFLLSDCKKDNDENFRSIDNLGNVILNTHTGSLQARVRKFRQVLELEKVTYNLTKAMSSLPVPDLTTNYVFRLVAEVDPPVYNGNTLQATHVKIAGNYAFVSYNTRGAKYLGGIDIFDVSDINNPVLLEEAIFKNADVSSVDYYKNKLYIAGAMDRDDQAPEYLSTPAVLEVLSLDDHLSISGVDTIIDLNSYNGTDVKVTDKGIYVTSGSNGFFRFFDHTGKMEASTALDHARALDVTNDNVYVLQGEPGRVNVFTTNDLTYKASYGVGEADQKDAQSGIVASDNYLFTALNEGGIHVMNMDGSVKQIIPRPAVPAGEDPENFVSNSVSFQNDLVLIANGEAGLYAGGLVRQMNDSLVIMGKVKFRDNASTNYVAIKDSIIFVATGLGGLKIVTVGVDNGMPPVIVSTSPCPAIIQHTTQFLKEHDNNMDKYPVLFSGTNTKEIVLTRESEVWLTFIDEGASYKNTLGFYAYDQSNPPLHPDDLSIVNKIGENVVLPNASMVNGGGALRTGDRVQVGKGKFPAGTVIGFYLKLEGFKNGVLSEGSGTFYTLSRFNQDMSQQHILYRDVSCGDIVVSFEDMLATGTNSDKDFNDLIFTVSDSSDPKKATDSFSLTNVPDWPK